MRGFDRSQFFNDCNILSDYFCHFRLLLREERVFLIKIQAMQTDEIWEAEEQEKKWRKLIKAALSMEP